MLEIYIHAKVVRRFVIVNWHACYEKIDERGVNPHKRAQLKLKEKIATFFTYFFSEVL